MLILIILTGDRLSSINEIGKSGDDAITTVNDADKNIDDVDDDVMEQGEEEDRANADAEEMPLENSNKLSIKTSKPRQMSQSSLQSVRYKSFD